MKDVTRSILTIFIIWVITTGLTLAAFHWYSVSNRNQEPAAICHTCLCNEAAEKCVRDCGSDGMCKVLCAHACSIHNGGKGICPIPKK